MKTYEIRWVFTDSDTEWITAENPEDAEKRFRKWSLSRLIGHDRNTAQILRITEKVEK